MARAAGLWHDLGKYAPEFQRYIERSHADPCHHERIDHSTAGAKLARDSISGGLGLSLAFVIAGHHAGLADFAGSAESSLDRRLGKCLPETSSALALAPQKLLGFRDVRAPGWFPRNVADRPLCASMLIRMLFSCLIDADRLATERFCDRGLSDNRSSSTPATVAQLRVALDAYLDNLRVERASDRAPVDQHRDALLAACRRAASEPPGVFTLTAPTGSGKTLASMAFALSHAQQHGLRAVFYAMPFTSVTEQNARVFRTAFGALGEHAVLEHHSAFRPNEGDEAHPTEIRRRLLAENWDAPVVVTTNVRLLESLFAANPSDARRLHRLARSVIVLDEAQTLPVHLMRPTLAALQELVDGYGVSFVLCSATMPAVTLRENFKIGLRAPREIVPDPAAMDRSMRRTRVVRVGAKDDDALVERLAACHQALAVVNTRKHAARLFTMLKARNVPALHLSAMMCPAHRSERVQEIKNLLKAGMACRVVSTQVIEAGVDVDFPIVLRAMAGLDSIVQAAGRCNREGRHPLATVEVFDTDESPPPFVRQSAEIAAQVLTEGRDALDLETIRAFFELQYWSRSSEWDGRPDSRGMSPRLTDQLRPPGDHHVHNEGFNFRTVAEEYRLIDDWSSPLVVPFGAKGEELCKRLQRDTKTSAADRQLAQRYTVSVSPFSMSSLLEVGLCAESPLGLTVLLDSDAYDLNLGLLLDSRINPGTLIG